MSLQNKAFVLGQRFRPNAVEHLLHAPITMNSLRGIDAVSLKSNHIKIHCAERQQISSGTAHLAPQDHGQKKNEPCDDRSLDGSVPISYKTPHKKTWFRSHTSGPENANRVASKLNGQPLMLHARPKRQIQKTLSITILPNNAETHQT